ncbi:hypothetical protein FM106_27065 [Brachybacterium faecium]|nr:hypothetical protein FM106_27065 [Brachybacterium faecium]
MFKKSALLNKHRLNTYVIIKKVNLSIHSTVKTADYSSNIR